VNGFDLSALEPVFLTVERNGLDLILVPVLLQHGTYIFPTFREAPDHPYRLAATRRGVRQALSTVLKEGVLRPAAWILDAFDRLRLRKEVGQWLRN
jgi:hypothetical protein